MNLCLLVRSPTPKQTGQAGETHRFGWTEFPRGGAIRVNPASTKLPVEIGGDADQCQVGEGLGEVAQLLARRADFLGVEPQVVGVSEQFLEHEPGLVQAPGASECFYVPEGAHRERALFTPQAVRGCLRVVAG